MFTSSTVWLLPLTAGGAGLAGEVAAHRVPPARVRPDTAAQTLWLARSEYLVWGELEEARRLMALSIEISDRHRLAATDIFVRIRDSMQALWEGRLEASAAAVERMQGTPAQATVAHVYGLRASLYLGRVSDLEPDLLPGRPGLPSTALVRAWAGRREAALEAIREWQGPAVALPAAPDTWAHWALISLIEAACILGDAPLAGWFAAPLWQTETITTGIFYTTLVQRHLAAAAALLGETAEARRRLELGLEPGRGHALPPRGRPHPLRPRRTPA